MVLALQEMGFVRKNHYEFILELDKERQVDLIAHVNVIDSQNRKHNSLYLEQRGSCIFLFDFENLEKVRTILNAFKD